MTTRCSFRMAAPVLTAVMAVATTAPSLALSDPCVLYVDGNAPGVVQDGLTWETAFQGLQEALAAKRICHPTEIRIAQGVYPPAPFDGSREDSFLVPDEVSLFGGYAGWREADPDERDTDRFETVLSGDLLGNDESGSSTWEDNSYHVITLAEGSTSTVLDGLTVTAGFANANGHSSGGGLIAYQAEFMLRNSKFIRNRAKYGGAIYSWESDIFAVDCDFVGNQSERNGGAVTSSLAHFTDCRFQQNHARGNGGAISGSSIVLENCDFEENVADWLGGAVSGGVTMTSCRFWKNRALVAGGALHVGVSDLRILNCEFLLNGSGLFGGAIHVEKGNILLGNCLILANTAGEGAGISVYHGPATIAGCTIVGNRNTYFGVFGAGIKVDLRGNARVLNTALWGNQTAGYADQETQVHVSPGATLQVNFSIVEGLTPFLGGVGNKGDDPLFVASGYWDDNATPDFFYDDVWVEGDFRLSPGSPAIDAGTNDAVPHDVTTDFAGMPRIVDDPATPNPGETPEAIVDIGAYEFQPVPPVEVFLDILPGHCPNILNVRSHGLIKVALLGTDEFDVAAVDPGSLLLSRTDGTGGSVKPIHTPPGLGPTMRDVATPFVGEPCACHNRRRDGADDLLLRFSTAALVEALHLDSVPADVHTISLTLQGELQGGTTFIAVDCVLPRHGKPPRRVVHPRR